jgi:hypothetical protein
VHGCVAVESLPRIERLVRTPVRGMSVRQNATVGNDTAAVGARAFCRLGCPVVADNCSGSGHAQLPESSGPRELGPGNGQSHRVGPGELPGSAGGGQAEVSAGRGDQERHLGRGCRVGPKRKNQLPQTSTIRGGACKERLHSVIGCTLQWGQGAILHK